MIEVEIWLDLMLDRDEGPEQVITLFARHEVLSIPRCGESISYMQAKGSSYRFDVVGSLGAMPQHILSTSVQEVRHYASGESEAIRYQTSLVLEPVTLGSLDDARQVVGFLTSQLSFELDPYGQSLLVETNAGGA